MIEQRKHFQKESREKLPINPTFFVCSGTSGAGLSTAITQIVAAGLVRKPPTQFVTRLLRPNEERGDQYYSVTDAILEKIPQQIVLEAALHGNRYGFFEPAVERIKKILQRESAIVDSANFKMEWANILDGQNIISIFFAPSDPKISLERIVLRARNSGAIITKEELLKRAMSNASSVRRISEFNYWINTTEFSTVIPDLASIINFHGYRSGIPPSAVLISENKSQISLLMNSYSIDLTSYVEELSLS